MTQPRLGPASSLAKRDGGGLQWSAVATKAIVGVVLLLLFFVSLDLMSTSFKSMGRGWAAEILAQASNPAVGLFVGILATAALQSSSAVTSLIVSLVAAGGLDVAGAVPIVIGANLGTTVTNTIVSLGYITRKDEFRRAMAGATVHDVFNLLCVALLFPLELTTGFISKTAAVFASGVENIGAPELLSPLKFVVDPVVDGIMAVLSPYAFAPPLLGILLLFVSLRYLADLLRRAAMVRAERAINRYVFGKTSVALGFGMLITVVVQSSSVTTSIVVPLVGAGLATVRQVFPFVVGANIGTTVTALIAALALAGGGEELGIAALQVAFVHCTFNVAGALIFLSNDLFRSIPVRIAERLGEGMAQNRAWALVYLGILFFVLPLLVIVLAEMLN